MFNKYVQELDLQSYDVFHECDPYKPTFFDVQNIMGNTFGYGKHLFTIALMNPEEEVMDPKLKGLSFKESSKILFEIVDRWDNVVYSGLTDIAHINGSAFAYFYIQEDIEGTYIEAANGPAKLVIVGELTGNGLPSKWKGTYNIRTQIPFYIRKQQPNTSDILFVDNPTINISQSYENYGDEPIDVLQQNDVFHIHSFDNLDTYSGEVRFVDISYRLSSSLGLTSQYTNVDTFSLTSSLELLTNNITKSHGNIPIGFFSEGNELSYWHTGSYTSYAFTPNLKQSSSISGNLSKDVLIISEHVAAHSIVRKATSDEEYTLTLDYSGSGAYGIIASEFPQHLTASSNLSATLDADDVTTWDVIYYKRFDDTDPTRRLGPKIDDDFYPSLDGTYDQVSFTIPSGSYFAVRLEGTESKNNQHSASFANVSVKQNPQRGINPSSYYYKSLVPHIDYNEDEIQYRYKFLNSNYDTAKNFDYYPVTDVIQSKSIGIEPYTEFLNRSRGGITKRIRHIGQGYQACALVGEAVGSASVAAKGSFVSPSGITGVYASALIGDDIDYSETAGVVAFRARTLTTTAANNTASAYSATFGGSDNAGDVIIEQRLGIGNFNTINQEHPSASLHVKGDIIAENYIVSSSVTHMTTSFSSGSTIFGDTLDDTHQFTGSLLVSSSIFNVTTDAVGVGEINPNGTLHISDTKNVLNDLNDQNDYHLVLQNPANDTGEGIGLGFSITQTDDNVGGAIVFKRNGSNDKGELKFYTKQSTTDQADPTEVLTLTDSGNAIVSGDISSSGKIQAVSMSLGSVHTPRAALSVDGDISGSGEIHLKAQQDIIYDLGLSSEAHLEYASTGLFKFISGSADPGTGNIYFELPDGGTGAKAKLGIGSYLLPPKELTVEGDMSGSGDLLIEGNITASVGNFSSHITASGNISASGNIEGDAIRSNDQKVAKYRTDESRIRFGNADTAALITGSLLTLGEHSGFHVTASGNISSSATVIGNHFKSDAWFSHLGDDDTGLYMEDDLTNLKAGGKSMIKLDWGVSNNKLILNNTNEDMDLWVNDSDGDVYLFGDAGNSRFGINTGATAGDNLPKTLTVQGEVSSSEAIFAKGTNLDFQVSASSDTMIIIDGKVSSSGDWFGNGNGIKVSGSTSESTLFTVTHPETGSLMEVTATPDSGSILVSGSILLKDNALVPSVSESRLYNSGSNLYFHETPIGPVQYEMLKGAMNDEISTSEIVLPFNNNFESTVHSDESGILCPVSGTLKTFSFRGELLDGDITYTLKAKTMKPGQTTSDTYTTIDTQTIDLVNANDNDPFTIVWDNDATIAPGDVLFFTVQGSADRAGTENYYFNAVIAWDYSTLPKVDTIYT